MRNLKYIALEDLKSSKNLNWLVNHQTPEDLVIYSKKKKALLDLGGLAYTIRNRDKKRYEVTLSSLCVMRRKLITNIISNSTSLLFRGAINADGIRTRISEGSLFFDWYDAKHPSAVLTTDDFELRFREYSFYLHENLNDGNLGPTAAYNRQGSAKKLLTWASGDIETNVGRGALMLPYPNNSVPAPLKKNIDAVLNLALHLFNQLENFITQNLSYPFLLKLPHERAWVVPATRWIYTKSRIVNRSQHTNANWIWDYTNGVIHDADWVQHFYGYNPAKAIDEREKVQKRLNMANNDPYHHRRLKLASWAYNSFMVLIFAITGANLSTFTDFPWSNDIKLEPSRQGFRAFKGRAGKVVSYEIKAKFIPYFRRYLRLRSFLLKDQEFPFLFFKIKNGKPEKVTEDFIDIYFQLAHKVLGMNLEPVNATEFRKYKTNWSANNLSIAEGAKLAQNSPQVFSEKYTSGNRLIQAFDITEHFNRLTKKIKADESQSVSIPAGGCTEYESPVSIGTDIQPACSKQICCFFCEHYLIHPDKEDVWKVLSIRHICSELTQAQQLGDGDTVSLIVVAIDSIIAEFMKEPITAEIISHCRSLINDGYLSEYWQEYFNLLLRLQVIQ